MQQLQQVVEHEPEHVARGPGGGRAGPIRGSAQRDLGQFEVPVAELVPGEVVERLAHPGELEPLEVRVHLGGHGGQPGQDPTVGYGQRRGVRQHPRHPRPVTKREPCRVPQLVAEVARASRPLVADRDVAARVGPPGQGEPGGIRTETVDPVDRVHRVAARLGHLLAGCVADQAVQRDVTERDGVAGIPVRHRVHAEHHHPGDPEEQDVVAGDEHAGRIEGAQVGRVVRPAEGGERPQGRGEPGVQHVGVLPPALSRRRLLVGPDAAHLIVRAVPDRDPVAPPQLPADAPVVHVVDPAEVAGRHLRRMQPGAAVPHRVARRTGQRADPDEPLQGQPRFDRRAATLAVPHRVQVRPDLGHDPALLAQRRDYGRAGLEAVQPLERAVRRDHAALVQHGQAGQAVPPADLEVVRIVRRGDLHRAGAERRVDVLIGDHRDPPAGQRQLHLAADQVPVPVVIGVHGHRGVAQHRLGAGGGDHDRVRIPLRGGVGGASPRANTAVADRDQLALVLAVVHLDVGQRGQAARAPVDDPLGAVDKAVVEEPLEDGLYGAGQALVHGEPLAGPVHAVAEAAHLGQDLPAGGRLPLPDSLDERLAAQVVPAQSLLGQLALDDVLGGDARVVHPRQPKRGVALHAAAPDDGVDDGVVERVADVQYARHVRGRDHDRERGGVPLQFGGEVTRLLPELVARPLHLAGRVLRRKLNSTSHEDRVY